MGAYSPAPVVTAALHERIMREVMEPTVAGLRAEGIRYTGFLYAGLMIGGDGTPRVLEYNCRLGDPEAQPILMRLNSDLVAHCLDGTNGRLHEARPRWSERTALGVVLAAGGYPGSYRKGDPIEGLDRCEGPDIKVFHAGTRADGTDTLTAGGRVLCVTALGSDVRDAGGKAYRALENIRFADMYWRKDIGHRALSRAR
jgi:phosphoribosylamine--glycine ligase